MVAWKSLTTLLVAAAVAFFLAACGDNGDDNGNGGAAAPEGGGNGGASTMLTLVAEDNEFDKDTLTAPANTEISIELENRDAGVLHNVSVYESSDAQQAIFMGELFAGEDTMTYTFQSPAPGEYFFRCDVHPDTMTGTFVAE